MAAPSEGTKCPWSTATSGRPLPLNQNPAITVTSQGEHCVLSSIIFQNIYSLTQISNRVGNTFLTLLIERERETDIERDRE